MMDLASEFLLAAVRVVSTGTIATLVAFLFIILTRKWSAKLHVWAIRLAYFKLIFLFGTAMTLPLPFLNAVDSVTGCREVAAAVASSGNFGWVAKTAFTIWLLGLIAQIVVLIKKIISFKDFSSQLQVFNDARVLSLVEAVSKKLSVTMPQVYSLAGIASPFIFGIKNKSLVLPKSISEVDDRTLKSVIFHELSHFKNKDPEWNVFYFFCETLFFFNPLVWSLKKQRLLLQEQMADEVALNSSGGNVRELAESILHFTVIHKAKVKYEGVFSMATNFLDLSRRLSKLQFYKKSSLHKAALESLAVIVVFIVLVLPWQSPGSIFESATGLTDDSFNDSTNEPVSGPVSEPVIVPNLENRMSKPKKNMNYIEILLENSKREKC